VGLFQTIGRLREFLSPRNLELLDVIFEGLTEVSKPPFNPFWVGLGNVVAIKIWNMLLVASWSCAKF